MKYFKDLNQKLKASYSRFPIALTWAMIGSLFCILTPYKSLFRENEEITLTLILGVSWLLATRFFIETIRTKYKQMLLLAPLAFLLLFYLNANYNLQSTSSLLYLNFWLYLLAGHVFLFFAPFLMHWNTNAYWNYLKNVLIAIGRSILFSLVLYLGLILAIAASEALFQLSLDGWIYEKLFVFCFGVVNTLMYTYDFPKKIQEQTVIQFKKPLEVFVKNILIPLLLVYFIILYLYSFKILLNWELPKGWVSGLTVSLALIGIVVHIIVYPIRKTHSSALLRQFYPWFFIFLLPLLGLLFIAISRRIVDYGVTEKRYLLLALAIWVLAMSIYLLISKKQQLRILPISIFVLLIISSFGPWGALQVSLQSQKEAFIKIYNQIDFDKKTIGAEEQNRFIGIVRYLSDRNQLNGVLEAVGIEHADKYAQAYNSGYFILKDLGVEKTLTQDGAFQDISETENSGMYKLFYNFRRSQSIEKQISDYDYFREINFEGIQSERDTQLYQNGKHLIYEEKNKVLFRFDLKENVGKLTDEHENFYDIDPQALEFYIENKSGVFDLIFEEIAFSKSKDAIELSRAKVIVLYKLNR